MLKFDKLHDSQCEDNSWIDGKFWQSFFIKRSQKLFFYFFPRFYFLTFFNFYLNVYYTSTKTYVTFLPRNALTTCTAWCCYSKSSVCLSVTLMCRGRTCRGRTCWVSSKLITRIISLGSSLLGVTTSAI